MANEQVQLRRGDTTENDNFTGAVGELVYDTEKKQLRIHDGEKVGGFSVDPLVAFQIPTEENGYTWYRLYASGWIEQGQNFVSLDSNGQWFTMPVEMTDARYNIQCTSTSGVNKTSTSVGAYVSVYDTKSTTRFQCYAGDDASFNTCIFCWRVSGMAKVGE